MYNLTQLQQSDTVYKLWLYANMSTGEILMGMLMVVAFFIIMMVLSGWDFTDRLLTSSFICFILSAILAYAKLLNFLFVIGFLAVLAFTVLFVILSRSGK